MTKKEINQKLDAIKYLIDTDVVKVKSIEIKNYTKNKSDGRNIKKLKTGIKSIQINFKQNKNTDASR